MKNKKQTATVSELIKALESLKEESGDAKVYVVHLPMNDAEVGNDVTFDGLSSNVAMMAIASTDEKGILIFQSDEILKP